MSVAAGEREGQMSHLLQVVRGERLGSMVPPPTPLNVRKVLGTALPN